MDFLLDPSIYISLLTLTMLEIVLGVDNIIVIAILVAKLPQHQQKKATFIGLSLAMITRVLLLLTLSWISHLIHPLFNIGSFEVTGRDIVLFLGGLFLIYKAGKELVEHLSLAELKDKLKDDGPKLKKISFTTVITQVVLIDIVFSLDSVITAIGVADVIVVMVLAVIIAIIIMMVFANAICNFIEKYPALKVLALSFLILVGILLVADGLHYHINKAYIYVAMGFSLWVVLMNIYYQAKKQSYLEQIAANKAYATDDADEDANADSPDSVEQATIAKLEAEQEQLEKIAAEARQEHLGSQHSAEDDK